MSVAIEDEFVIEETEPFPLDIDGAHSLACMGYEIVERSLRHEHITTDEAKQEIAELLDNFINNNRVEHTLLTLGVYYSHPSMGLRCKKIRELSGYINGCKVGSDDDYDDIGPYLLFQPEGNGQTERISIYRIARIKVEDDTYLYN